MSEVSELRADMSKFIRKYIRSDKDFTIKDMCKACDLSFEKRADVQRVYAVILQWRNISQTKFNQYVTAVPLKERKTAEEGWDAFIKKLNKENIFLLFSMRNDDGKAVYYQPSWVDKEMLDFVRMRKQLNGQLTILFEMDLYGEDFPEEEGILLSPAELATEMLGTLGKAQLRISRVVEDKIKELTPPKE